MSLPVAIAVDLVNSDANPLVRSVALTLRSGVTDLVPQFPKPSLVSKWRKDLDVAAQAQVPKMEAPIGDKWADIECELPKLKRKANDDVPEVAPAKRPAIDPIRLIKGLRFAHLLRDTATFSEGMAAAHDFDAKSEDEGTRDAVNDPGKSTLRRAYAKLDVTGILIQRRQMKADRLADRVMAVNIFSDASPVTGEELQGMIMEVIYTSKEVRRDILPGSTLHYGNYDAVSKGVCLLFALWLVAGPFFCDLNWLLSKVVCICTDFGVEMRTVEFPWILRAFFAWLNGTDLLQCRPLVDHSRRLFHRALRISGWSTRGGT